METNEDTGIIPMPGSVVRCEQPQQAVVLSMKEKIQITTAMAKMFGWEPNEGLVLGLMAESEGMNIVEASNHWDVIKGKPARKSISMRAKIEAAGVTIKTIQRDSEACILEFCLNGNKQEFSWTHDDAKGYMIYEKGRQIPICDKFMWKGKKKRQTMLYNRTLSEGCRATLPSAFMNCYTADEIEDSQKEAAPEYIPAVNVNTVGSGEAFEPVESEVMVTKEQVKFIKELTGSAKGTLKAIREKYGKEKNGKNMTAQEAGELINDLKAEADAEKTPEPTEEPVFASYDFGAKADDRERIDLAAEINKVLSTAPEDVIKAADSQEFDQYSTHELETYLGQLVSGA